VDSLPSRHEVLNQAPPVVPGLYESAFDMEDLSDGRRQPNRQPRNAGPTRTLPLRKRLETGRREPFVCRPDRASLSMTHTRTTQ